MHVIVEQSKTDVRSVSVFSRSCSLAAWPFMSKPWISTERATVWGCLWCHFAVHCVTKKKKKSSAFEVFAVLSADDRKADAALASHAPTCRSVCVCVCPRVFDRGWSEKGNTGSKGWTFIKTETRAFRFAASGVRQVTYRTLSLLYRLLINRLQ